MEPESSDAELKESQSLILDASDRAAGLCSLLLGFSQPGKEDADTTSLDLVLEEMEHILRKLVSRGVDFQLKKQAGLPRVVADRGRVEMCLLNLVINSNDAAGTSSIVVETRAHGQNVELLVSDDGEGMDTETLGQVLQPFFTTKGKGTGLGLSVVNDAMEQAGGGMHIESHVGQGTIVSLRFNPALEQPAT